MTPSLYSAMPHSQLELLGTTPDNRFRGNLFDSIASLPNDWRLALEQPAVAQQLHVLNDWLNSRLEAGAIIYPTNPFNALHLTAAADTRVIILGQDPYHGPNQAQGLAFSVPDSVKCPPSLRNIFKELAQEYPQHPPATSHDLQHWCKQGVLLLNTSLTVEDGAAGSHAKKGWETITDALLLQLLRLPTPKVFMLWGAHAQSKLPLIETEKTGPVLTLCSNHPSPLSATRPPVPFIGNQHFTRANEWLRAQQQTPIQWL